MHHVVCKGLTGLILVEGIITNQQYLQQLHNELIPVIQEAGQIGIFFQQGNVCPHIGNAAL
jgi:hypothetical protein